MWIGNAAHLGSNLRSIWSGGHWLQSDASASHQRVGLGIAAPGRPFVEQALLTIVFVAASFSLNGYIFGGADHAIHFPFIERELSPGYLAGDPLVDRAQYHPSYLWLLVATLLHIAPLNWIYLGLHVLSLACLYSGTAALARALSPVKVAAVVGLLAATMVLLVRFSSAGLNSFDIMVLNRTLSLGPLLFALALAAVGRFKVAFFLAGLTFDIHPTTAVHGAALVWVAALVSPARRTNALIAPLWMVLGASPLLVLMLATGAAGGVPFPAPQDWFEAQRLLLWFHHFPSLWPLNYWLVLLPPLVAIAITLHARANQVLVSYLAAITLTCVGGFVGIEVLQIPSMLHLHPQEILRFLPYLAAASLAGWAAVSWTTTPASRLRAAAAVTALALDQALTFPAGYTIASSFSFWVLAAVLALEILRPQSGLAAAPYLRVLKQPAFGMVLAMLSVMAVCGHYYRRLPIITSYSSHYESKIAAWSREHLPTYAVVATPPYYYLGSAPLLNYRWAAGRSVLATLKDGGETTFSLSYFNEWRHRLEDEIGHPLNFAIPDDFRGHPDDWVIQAVADYGTADRARFQLLASRYGVTHAITEVGAKVQPDLPLLYRDDKFNLYEVTPETTASAGHHADYSPRTRLPIINVR